MDKDTDWDKGWGDLIKAETVTRQEPPSKEGGMRAQDTHRKSRLGGSRKSRRTMMEQTLGCFASPSLSKLLLVRSAGKDRTSFMDAAPKRQYSARSPNIGDNGFLPPLKRRESSVVFLEELKETKIVVLREKNKLILLLRFQMKLQ